MVKAFLEQFKKTASVSDNRDWNRDVTNTSNARKPTQIKVPTSRHYFWFPDTCDVYRGPAEGRQRQTTPLQGPISFPQLREETERDPVRYTKLLQPFQQKIHLNNYSSLNNMLAIFNLNDEVVHNVGLYINWINPVSWTITLWQPYVFVSQGKHFSSPDWSQTS